MDEELEVSTTEVSGQAQTPSIEDEARLQGWVPKEEFRGNEADWISADVFVQRGKEINPILRKNNERILKELDMTKKQMEELRKATEDFKKFQKEAFERRLHEYEEEILDLKEMKKKAVSEGDGDLVVKIDDQIDELKTKKAEASKEEVEADTKPTVDPKIQAEIEDWTSENSWYTQDSKLRAVADSLADTVRREHPYLIGKEFLEKLDEALTEVGVLEKVSKKTKSKNPMAGGSRQTTTSTDKGGKQSYENLPADAKAACDKFVKQKLMTREEYVQSYDWS